MGDFSVANSGNKKGLGHWVQLLKILFLMHEEVFDIYSHLKKY